MVYCKEDLMQYVEENDVKFVKLTFCDIFGRTKNISIIASELASAFEKGVLIDSCAITGISGTDFLLFPQAALLSQLPWRPKSGRVASLFCEIHTTDGKRYCADAMKVLEDACQDLQQMGLECSIGTECEFYVFKNDNNGKLVPFDDAGYCACAPYDMCENLRRDVVISLEDMGLKPISSHHERGKGQNEIDFAAADPLSSARNFLMFKAAVKNVCAISGARASFMPKPLFNEEGSGLHVNITLRQNGKDLSVEKKGAFVEGVLNRYRDISCFANTTQNSYDRLGTARPVTYGMDKKCAVRLNGATIQLRTPDSACNPFLLFALVIKAGLEGIRASLKLRDKALVGDTLFMSFEDALNHASKSSWLKGILGSSLSDCVSAKKQENAEAVKLGDTALLDFYADL